MLSQTVIDYLKGNSKHTIIQIALIVITYVLIRYRFNIEQKFRIISSANQRRAIRDFKPADLVEEDKEMVIFRPKVNVTSFDVFNLKHKYKDEMKEIIRNYGIGTCGPRGFYGTVDIHLKLENKLSEIFDKEESILYPNYYYALSSIISCFCKCIHTVYIGKNAQHAIIDGVTLSKSQLVYYDDLRDLEEKLDMKVNDKYVIVEDLEINTGTKADLNYLVKLKQKYGFRIILDVGHSFPLLRKNEKEEDAMKDIDIIIGSLGLGFPCNGGFSSGPRHIATYQRLGSSSYVFSASIPAFLVESAYLMLNEELDYHSLAAKINYSRFIIKNIVSHKHSPILLIQSDYTDILYRKLQENGFGVGVNGKYIRIIINTETKEEDIKSIAEVIKKESEIIENQFIEKPPQELNSNIIRNYDDIEGKYPTFESA